MLYTRAECSAGLRSASPWIWRFRGDPTRTIDALHTCGECVLQACGACEVRCWCWLFGNGIIIYVLFRRERPAASRGRPLLPNACRPLDSRRCGLLLFSLSEKSLFVSDFLSSLSFGARANLVRPGPFPTPELTNLYRVFRMPT